MSIDLTPQAADIKERFFLRYHDSEISACSPEVKAWLDYIKIHDNLEPIIIYITQGLENIQEFVYRKTLKGALWTVRELCSYNKYVTVCTPKRDSNFIYYRYSILVEDKYCRFEFFVPKQSVCYNLYINKDRIINKWISNSLEDSDKLTGFFKEISKHMLENKIENFLIVNDRSYDIKFLWKKRKHFRVYNYILP